MLDFVLYRMLFTSPPPKEKCIKEKYYQILMLLSLQPLMTNSGTKARNTSFICMPTRQKEIGYWEDRVERALIFILSFWVAQQ